MEESVKSLAETAFPLTNERELWKIPSKFWMKRHFLSAVFHYFVRFPPFSKKWKIHVTIALGSQFICLAQSLAIVCLHHRLQDGPTSNMNSVPQATLFSLAHRSAFWLIGIIGSRVGFIVETATQAT
jgi:hypothetical protein